MERPADDKVDGKAHAHEAQWTLAVDLSVDLRDQKGHVTGAGTFNHWQQLKGLVEKTKDAPVAVVVSLPHVDAAAKDVAELQRKLAEKADSKDVDTYLISNGKLQLVESHASNGLDSDVEQLLRTAQKVAPSERLALSVMAHGWGTEVGMSTDRDTASTEQLHDAIKRGLGQREKLDVLDFDACKMASTDTANRMQDVTKYMVASADDEAASMNANFDGQNISAAVNGLIAKPEKTAKQFANDLVAQADQGANGTPSRIPEVPNQLRSGTDTLIAIDMEKYKEFETNLNAFASLLQPHLNNTADRAAIGSAIDRTASFPSHVPLAQNDLRDTKQFARNILEQINQHKLTDDDGKIKTTAEKLIEAQTAMTERLHKNSKLYAGDIGGLTTFLPVTSPQSRHEIVRSRFAIQAIIADMPEWQRAFQYKPIVQQNGQFAIGMTAANINEADRHQLDGLLKAYKHVAAAADQKEYNKATTELQTEGKRFMKTPLADRLITELQRNVRSTDGDPTRSPWMAFVDDLVTHSQADK